MGRAIGALNENDCFRLFAVRRALNLAPCRAACRGKPFKLKSCENIRVAAIAILSIESCILYLKTGSHHNGAYFKFNQLIFHVKVDCPCRAYSLACLALSVFKVDAVPAVYDGFIGNSLCKGSIDCRTVCQPAVKFSRNFFAGHLMIHSPHPVQRFMST